MSTQYTIDTAVGKLNMPWPYSAKTLEILSIHAHCVYQKALSIAKASLWKDELDYDFLYEAIALHDHGIAAVFAPELGCEGQAPYLMHGHLGAEALRQIDARRFERHARVCERHIGSGLTAEEILRAKLPLPVRDFLPENLEEKLVTYADNFYSKKPDKLDEELSLQSIRQKFARFGESSLARLEDLVLLWAPQNG